MKYTTSLIFLMMTLAGFSQESAEDLAKKLANPVASLISVPFQNNTDYGIGDRRGTKNTLNFQPVVPIGITPKLNLIARVILPIVTQYHITGQGNKENGLSDMVLSAFLSPSNSKGGFTWGAGPVLLIPTGTNRYLSARKFGMGPTVVALKQLHGWTLGGLANQIWSIAGDKDRTEVNQLFLQPFINYNWKTGAGVGINAEWTENWSGNTSVVWLNPTVSGVTSLGKQKVSLAVGPRFNIIAPHSIRADWGWRAVVVLIFPKK